MSAGVGDWNPVLLDRAVRTDKRGRTDRSFGNFPLGVFARSPRAVSLHRFFLGIREQHEGEIELADEVVVGVDPIGTDTDHHCVRFGHCIDSVAEPARFFGSARCIVFRIKPQHDVFPGVFAERMLLAIAPRQSKGRGLLSFKIRHRYLRVS